MALASPAKMANRKSSAVITDKIAKQSNRHERQDTLFKKRNDGKGAGLGMIAYIKGEITEIGEDYLVLETGHIIRSHNGQNRQSALGANFIDGNQLLKNFQVVFCKERQ